MMQTISLTDSPLSLSGRESIKREKILQGAMQEFLAKGYAAASMDRVAAAAGVSKATVYSHFNDKETLFKFLVEQMAQMRMRSILSRMNYDLPPRQALRELLMEGIEDCCTNVEFQDFKRMLIGESGRFPELAKTFVENLAKPGVEALTEYFQQSPGFDFPDPEAIARIVVGAIVHFGLVQNILHGKDLMPMEAARIIDGLEYLLFPPDRID
jgi:TetR/AcrR family transcriptional regulator, regulator of autoinduction and epiphytic fitness